MLEKEILPLLAIVGEFRRLQLDAPVLNSIVEKRPAHFENIFPREQVPLLVSEEFPFSREPKPEVLEQALGSGLELS